MLAWCLGNIMIGLLGFALVFGSLVLSVGVFAGSLVSECRGLGNILIGLLACWVLLSGFCFASTLCWSVCWLVGFWMLVPMPLFWYLQLPRYSP